MQTRHYSTEGLAPLGNWTLIETRAETPEEDHAQDTAPVLPPHPSIFKSRPPHDLFIRGRPDAFELLNRIPQDGLAVVGTRRPQPRSLNFVRSTIHALRDQKLVILSGLALGVDAAAHIAALERGLPTIAILGSPIDTIYPPENETLASRILENGGLLVSETHPLAPIRAHNFLLRNRLIAGWAKATWVVEASHRSGALNTAQWAFDNNRDTYATPSFPGDPAFVGNIRLFLEHKARPLFAVSDLQETWPAFATLSASSPSLAAPHKMPQYNDGSLNYDSLHLKKEVLRATTQQGGISVEGLLDWAVAENWNPQRFFEALQVCLDGRHIQDRGGILYV